MLTLLRMVRTSLVSCVAHSRFVSAHYARVMHDKLRDMLCNKNVPKFGYVECTLNWAKGQVHLWHNYKVYWSLHPSQEYVALLYVLFNLVTSH